MSKVEEYSAPLSSAFLLVAETMVLVGEAYGETGGDSFGG